MKILTKFYITCIICHGLSSVLLNNIQDKKGGILKTLKKYKSVGIMLVLLILAVVIVVTSFGFHWRYDVVISGSMEPALRVGSLVVTRPIAPEEIKAGDVVTFRLNKIRITHRVIGIEQDEFGNTWFQTKGDANEGPDSFTVGSTTGKGFSKSVGCVPYLGYAVAFFKSKLVFLLAAAVIVLLAAWMFIPIIKEGFKEVKKEKE